MEKHLPNPKSILEDVKLNHRYSTFILLTAGILAIFILRPWLAKSLSVPYTFHSVDILIMAGGLAVLVKGYPSLRQQVKPSTCR